MGWEALIPIIAQYGIPLAESLWTKWSNKNDITLADWAELKNLSAQSASDQAKAAIVKAGLSLTDPKAIEILSLLP